MKSYGGNENLAAEFVWWFANAAANFPEAWSSFKETAYKIAKGLSGLGLTEEDVPEKLRKDTFIRLLALFRAVMERPKDIFQFQLAKLDVFKLAKSIVEVIDFILSCPDCSIEEKKAILVGLLISLPPLGMLWWVGGEVPRSSHGS